MWAFFLFSCVFYFLKSDRYWKGFLNKRKKTSSKSMKKCVKLIKIIKIQAIWTLLERVMQARINLGGFLNFLYVFINWFSKGFLDRKYGNYTKKPWISKKIHQRTTDYEVIKHYFWKCCFPNIDYEVRNGYIWMKFLILLERNCL